MKRLFVLFVLAAMPAVVAAQQAPSLNSGNGLLARAEADERLDQGRARDVDLALGASWRGFVAGVAWTLDDIDPRVCLPEGSNLGQVSAVVLQYLRQNPAQLHRPSQVLIREALQRAFPCPTGR
jgi:hypothetical protein